MSNTAAIKEADEFFRAGNFLAAENAVGGVLALDPGNAQALHLLGLIRRQSGNLEEAKLLLCKADEAMPGNSQFISDCASIFHAQGHFDEAAKRLRTAVGLSPRDSNLLFKLAGSLRALGDIIAAREALEAALACSPAYFDALVNLSEICRTLGDSVAAASRLAAAVALRPGWAEGHNALGLLYEKAGNNDRAQMEFIKAIELAPANPDPYNNLGMLCAKTGDVRRAMEHYKTALQLRPDFPEARYNLGNCLRDIEEYDAAILSFRAAVRLRPSFTEAIYNLGEALDKTGNYEEAEDCFAAIVSADGIHAKAHSSLLWTLNYDPRYGPAKLYEQHKKFGVTFERPLHRSALRPCDAAPGRRLKIGYVSADFNNHPVARFMAPVVRNHDRSQFEIFCYSGVEKPDAQTEFFRRHCDTWIDAEAMPDESLAGRIRQDGIDVLVDLSGHSAGNRLPLFALRPAPVQATYLGYPNTTGLSSIDFRLTDSITDPPGEPRVHTENLLRLDGCFCCYAPPPAAPDVGPLPADTAGAVTFGSTHTLSRLNKSVVELWSEVLRALPLSRLLIFRTTLHGEARARLSGQFEACGVAPGRITMLDTVPPQGHLAVYNSMDIMLDTRPWSGHASACESLWMGVPVVTLATDRFAGRMVASVLSCVSLGECIARSREEFVARATSLASSLDKLRLLRGGLRDTLTASPLCDGARFTRGLESAYRRMWNDCCRKERPNP